MKHLPKVAEVAESFGADGLAEVPMEVPSMEHLVLLHEAPHTHVAKVAVS